MSLVKKYISAYSSSSLGLEKNLFLVEDEDTAGTFYKISGDALQGLILEGNSINTGTNTILTTGSTNIDDSNIDGSAGIDASKIANGIVSNTEFQYINGATSNFQAQINNIVSRKITIETRSNASKEIEIEESDIQDALGWNNNLADSINYYTFDYSVHRVTGTYSKNKETPATAGDWYVTGQSHNSTVHLNTLFLTVRDASTDYIINIYFNKINATALGT